MTKHDELDRDQTATAQQSLGETPEQKAYTILVRTAARLEAELNRVFRPLDLTNATYSILRILEGAGSSGSSCGDISEQLIAEVPDMTRLLDRLERLGYVLRERSNIDRRMVKVTITDKGRAVLDTLRDPVSACHQRQFGVLGDSRTAQLQELLTVLLTRARSENESLGDVVETSSKQPSM